MTKNPPRNRQGISRILEAVIAATILLLTFSAAAVMIQSQDVQILQEGGDLDRLGYNVLTTIIESKIIDNPQTNSNLKTIIQSNIPSTIYYKFTTFNCINQPDGTIKLEINPNHSDITNTNSPDTFTNLRQISSTSTTYTSTNGQIYKLVFQLTRAGN